MYITHKYVLYNLTNIDNETRNIIIFRGIVLTKYYIMSKYT